MVVPTLVVGARDKVFAVRFAAAEVLGHYQAEAAVATPVLEEGLVQKSLAVQGRARTALIGFGMAPMRGATYYVTNERGWDPGAVSYALTLGYSLAIIGYATAGPMLDFAGRRMTATLYFTIGAISAYVCFTAESAIVITVAYVVVLGMHALWPIAATITSEIFPTAIRGTGNAVVNNLLGRTGMALAPAIVGSLSAVLGSVGQAVALVALVPFACIPIILLMVSETKGKELEDINQ